MFRKTIVILILLVLTSGLFSCGTQDRSGSAGEKQAAGKEQEFEQDESRSETETDEDGTEKEDEQEASMDEILKNITVNTQSSIRIEGSKTIYVDPYKRTDAVHDADIILITHAHYDHFDPPSLRNVANKHSFIICPDSMKNEVDAVGLESEDGSVMKAGAKITPEGRLGGEVTIEAVPAYNLNKNFHPKANGWLGYIIKMDGVRYYAAGDTDALPELEDIACDVAFVPVGGTYTMTASEAAGLVNSIAPKVAVPIHYGTIVGRAQDAVTFRDAVSKDIEVVTKVEDAKQ